VTTPITGAPAARVKFARYAAIHEAAHAVADTVLLHGVKEAKLWRESRHTVGSSIPVPQRSVSCRMVSIVAYAGPIAHAQYQRRALAVVMFAGGMGDLAEVDKDCRHTAKAFRMSPHAADLFRIDWHWRAEHEARKLVRQHWAWINRVADHLQKHGRISGAQVRRLRRGTGR
jgi:hypothetical protein